jgi:hypothetical protein
MTPTSTINQVGNEWKGVANDPTTYLPTTEAPAFIMLQLITKQLVIPVGSVVFLCVDARQSKYNNQAHARWR